MLVGNFSHAASEHSAKLWQIHPSTNRFGSFSTSSARTPPVLPIMTLALSDHIGDRDIVLAQRCSNGFKDSSRTQVRQLHQLQRAVSNNATLVKADDDRQALRLAVVGALVNDQRERDTGSNVGSNAPHIMRCYDVREKLCRPFTTALNLLGDFRVRER